MSYNGSLSLAQPAANRVFQRDTRAGGAFGKGAGAVALTLTASAPVTLLEAQLRDAGSPGTVLVPWSSAAANLGAGAQSVTLTLPANAAWYLIDLRANADAASVVSTTAPIGVGEVIVASGQSLATDFWSTYETGDTGTIAGNGVVPSPYGVCLANWEVGTAPAAGTGWVAPADGGAYKSSFAAEFLRLAVLGSGVNCSLVGYAYGGEPISSWAMTGGTPKPVWTTLTSTLDNALGAGGKFGTFVWCHGHNDARLAASGIDGDLLTTAQYLAALTGLMTALAARYSGFAFKKILSSVPAIGANWITVTPKYDAAHIEFVRAAHLQYLGIDAKAVGHVDGLDIPLWLDQTHPSQAGNVVFARHFYRAFMNGLGASAYGDKGPSFAGTAARAPGSNQIVLPVNQAGGNALSCTGGASGAATQFTVYPAGTVAIPIAVSAADLSKPGRITLTLASTPPDTLALDVWYRLPPDGAGALLAANQIYDNNAAESAVDGLATGRQLALVPYAITAPAPNWHRPILIAPGVPMMAAPGALAFAL